MCNCISKLQKDMVGRQFKGKKIAKAEFVSAAFIGPNFELKATGELELLFDDGKKKGKQSVVYTFCPFCGIKYRQTEDMQEVPEDETAEA